MTLCPKVGVKDCALVGIGRECLALSDTDFKGKPCPFYKPSIVDYEAKLVFKGFDGYWKPIRGYEGKYFVSDMGEIISSRHQTINKGYRSGKPFVQLIDRIGGYKRYYVVDIVADAFLAGRGKVEFKDNNVMNCKLTNLYRRR